MVTCTVCDTGLDVVITGSADGTIIVHTLHKGKYVRSIVPDMSADVRAFSHHTSSRTHDVLTSSGSVHTAVNTINEWSDHYPTGSNNSSSSNREVCNSSSVRVGKKRLPRLEWVGVTINGDIVTYSLEDFHLTVFSINGKQLVRKDVNERLHAFLFSEDGEWTKIIL